MSLKLIYGSAGTGKTSICFNEIVAASNSGDNVLVLTPQHISLQTERNIAKLSGLNNAAKIEVAGFGRLAASVFSKVGPVIANYADSSVKAMLIKRILINNAKELNVLKKNALLDSFALTMLDTINVLKSSQITPENLREIADRTEIMLTKLKLYDIALVYEKYNLEFNEDLYNADDNLSRLCEKIYKYNLFDGYKVFLDGFNGFSKEQYDVIEALLIKASAVTVTCPTDSLENNDASVFFRGITMADKLFKLALDNNVEILPNIFLEENLKYKNNPELLHLEQNINKFPPQKFNDVPDNISIYEACDYYDEAFNTAKTIYKLCREKGLRYNDIAVVCRDFNTYLPAIKKAFSDYKISYNASEKTSALAHPFIDDVLSALSVFINKFSQFSLIKWIKADFHDFLKKEIYLLENYIIACGSNEKMWSQPLKFKGGLSDKDFDLVCESAPKILESILDFSQLLKGRKTFKSISNALVTLLDEQYIIKRYNALNNAGELQKATELINVYNALISVINNINLIFGDAATTAEKYLEIIRSGLAASSIGQIPANADSVTICEPDLYKEDKKVVFLMGVSAGVFPKGYINEGLISEEDKKLIEDNGFSAPDNNLIKHKAENYLIYTMLSAPTEKLYLSYPSNNFDGDIIEPSRVIKRITDIFPKISIVKGVYERTDTIENVDGVIPTFNRLVAGDYKGFGATVEKWYKENQPMLYSIIEKSKAYRNDPEMLNKEVLRELYGDTPFYSISKIEQYNRCAFAYFLNYGLKAKLRRENSAKASDLGTIMHEVIEKYTLYAREIGFSKITAEQCHDKARELTVEALESCLGNVYFESRKGKTALKKITNILRGVLWNITGFYKESSYSLYGCEVDFGTDGTFPPIEIKLDNGAVAMLTGKIDRVDLYKTDDKYFVNVVDYKSSDKTIDYAETLFGVQIQLPVYIDAICKFLQGENNVTTVPAAMLYCKIDYSPVKAGRETTNEEIIKEIKNSLKMKGLVVDNTEVIKAMGQTYAVKPDATRHQLELMCKNAYKKISTTINEILTGDTSILPVNISGTSHCEYCDYKAVCFFDPLFGNREKTVGKISKEDYFKYVGKMD